VGFGTLGQQQQQQQQTGNVFGATSPSTFGSFGTMQQQSQTGFVVVGGNKSDLDGIRID
jgi:hypothetical protein